MAQWQKNAVHELEILNYTAEGMGVARLEGRVVFIPHTIRGERWMVRLEKVNKNVAWGRGVELLSPSPERIGYDCPLAGKCGGCQFRHMTYGEELQAKRQRVEDALHRVGGVTVLVPEVTGAEVPDRYRNKVQFPIAALVDKNAGIEGLSVGYYRPRSHHVLNVEDCMLQPELVTQLRRVFTFTAAHLHLPAYDEATGKGLLRHLYFRTNSIGEALCCIVVNGDSLPHADELIEQLREACPSLVGVVLNINKKDTNVILGDTYKTLWGQDYLEETLCGMKFRLSVPSFFQINRAQTEVLYAKALEFADLKGS